jgi:hypothetical protein
VAVISQAVSAGFITLFCPRLMHVSQSWRHAQQLSDWRITERLSSPPPIVVRQRERMELWAIKVEKRDLSQARLVINRDAIGNFD